jgi:hypothetical protein
MSYRKLFKISVLVLTVAAIGLVLLPANAQNKITCDGGAECVLCSDQCQDGLICWALVCSNGSASGCTPCVETKKQPGSGFQKGTHGEQGDKALLAQLLSKDPEVTQALRSLK